MFNDVVCPVNTGKSGIDSTMLSKILNQVEAMLSYHNKLIIVRLDLHQPLYTPDNKHLTPFFKREFKRLKHDYKINRVGYVWVREREKAKAQHYHIALMLDGNKVKNPHPILIQMGENWKFWADGTYHIPEASWYRVKRNNGTENDFETTREMVYRLSYLAKGRGKGYRKQTANDYSTSRIKQNLQN